MISMIVGVVAVVLTSVAGLVAREVFIAQEEQRTARAVTFLADVAVHQPSPTAATDLARTLGDRLRGQAADLVIVAEVPGRLLPAPAASDHDATDVTLVLYVGDYPAVRRLPLLAGSWPGTGADFGELPPRLALNAAAAATLSRPADRSPDLGDRSGGTVALRAGQTRPQLAARVIGTVADGRSDARVYLPWETAGTFLPGAAGPDRLQALVHVASDPDRVRAALQIAWRDQGVTVESTSRYDHVAALLDQLAALRTLFAWCAAVALAVSALGIVNLGLATVTHRARELSVRRAVGARRMDLFALVLSSAVATGLLSAGTGILLVAVAVRAVVPRYVPAGSAIAPPDLPWSAVLAGCLAALATAIIGSLLPALRATRVDIASVLRD
jgi:hypothetical protein